MTIKFGGLVGLDAWAAEETRQQAITSKTARANRRFGADEAMHEIMRYDLLEIEFGAAGSRIAAGAEARRDVRQAWVVFGMEETPSPWTMSGVPSAPSTPSQENSTAGLPSKDR